MKIQLLMIIAVIASSILTISQRANAQEVNQFRWLEPTLEQRCGEVVAPDQENGTDNEYVAYLPEKSHFTPFTSTPLLRFRFPIIAKVNGNIIPRAPPLSLI
ncbi:hypothetical protein [Marinomonas profundimaris]|uniref:Uncharacterized protein n=1 Tax=Marinomonas profundimaris TaxID=1208321 RepID=W1RT49_9GAMM|nr:hypothetical protein [Marinomonas profundimaris]ETI58043.1 hypothetical protein D104_17075 [Marinomonas profundimaris]